MTALCVASCLLVGGLALSESSPSRGTAGLTFRDIAYASKPVNVSPPKISGVSKKGKTLTTSRGKWTNSPLTFAFQWERCSRSGGSCKSIHHATGDTLKLTDSDVGHTLRVTVIASNSGGSSKPARSSHTGVVKS